MSDSLFPTSVNAEPRAVRILAKSVFRELKQSGLATRDMIAFTSELLELVASDARGEIDASDAE